MFDFIEEMHERGAPMREALLDVGFMRMRPGHLALYGGPLWQPLCYAQTGGLSFASFVTLLLVLVLYTIAIQD